MSVSFIIRGHDDQEINVSNANARDLLEWLRVTFDEECIAGSIRASELAARCRRRLWPEFAEANTGRETVIDAAPGRATLISCGRDPDYLQRRTEQLLALCELDLNAEVHFG